MIRVAAYCRVSTEDQANSFEAQQRYFREYIQSQQGWELYEIYADEGITGTSTKKRIQFYRMIQDAYEGKFHLIITKEVSRFSRNVLDTISYTRELKAIGVGVIFAADRINTLDPEAEMLLSLLASLAQEESRRTSNRVVWGQTRQMEKGVVFGRSLLGYDVKNGVLTVNKEGAEIVRLIFHQYTIEQVSASKISQHLNCKGYYTYRKKREWTSNGVLKILNNEKYVGDLVQKKTYTPDFLTHTKRTNKGEVPFVTMNPLSVERSGIWHRNVCKRTISAEKGTAVILTAMCFLGRSGAGNVAAALWDGSSIGRMEQKSAAGAVLRPPIEGRWYVMWAS